MAFNNGYGIVKRKAHGDREERKKQNDVFEEIFKSVAINLSEHHPIAHKKYNRAHNKKAHKIKIEP